MPLDAETRLLALLDFLERAPRAQDGSLSERAQQIGSAIVAGKLDDDPKASLSLEPPTPPIPIVQANSPRRRVRGRKYRAR